MAERRRFGIGYALAPKKRQSFIQESLLSLANERGLDLVPIDTSRPLADQGPFDCVLHKLYGDDWNAQLQDFKTRNPSSTVLDAPDSIARLHNRISMLQAVSELNIDTTNTSPDSPSFGIPNQIVIYDMDALHHDHAWDRLKFPVIAKPLVADGTAKSHKMALVFNRDGFSKLKPPIVLQEFVNHGGVIFKVYVVGDYVKCMKRKSLPDVSEEKLASLEGSLSFSQVSNMTNERNNAKYCEIMKLYDTEMPPQSFITDIARGLRRAMKLNLFNFDVIRDVRIGNRYLVIDINYFPGYAKMPCYETVLTDFLWDVVNKKERVLLKGKCGEEGGGGNTERLVHSCDREVRKVANSSCCSDGEDKETVIKV